MWEIIKKIIEAMINFFESIRIGIDTQHMKDVFLINLDNFLKNYSSLIFKINKWLSWLRDETEKKSIWLSDKMEKHRIVVNDKYHIIEKLRKLFKKVVNFCKEFSKQIPIKRTETTFEDELLLISNNKVVSFLIKIFKQLVCLIKYIWNLIYSVLNGIKILFLDKIIKKIFIYLVIPIFEKIIDITSIIWNKIEITFINYIIPFCLKIKDKIISIAFIIWNKIKIIFINYIIPFCLKIKDKIISIVFIIWNKIKILIIDKIIFIFFKIKDTLFSIDYKQYFDEITFFFLKVYLYFTDHKFLALCFFFFLYSMYDLYRTNKKEKKKELEEKKKREEFFKKINK